MFSVDNQLIEKLTQPGQRLPYVKNWLMNSVWSQDRYENLQPLEYLHQGESDINNFEKLIASTADRTYSEFIESNNKDISSELSNTETAVVVFDGMSIRELPILVTLARKSGFRIIEQDYAFSAIPSETIDFVEQRLNCGRIGPSQLPGRRELTERGIKAVYLSSNTQALDINSNGKALLIWSAFPDNTYADSGAKFDKHFENICIQIQTAWMHSVQLIKAKKRIIITSDHGYVFFGSGLAFERKRSEIEKLNRFFGNERSKRLEEEAVPFESDDVFVARNYAMVKGRVQTRSTGQAATRLYKHGGMSLMECFTPWLVLETS